MNDEQIKSLLEALQVQSQNFGNFNNNTSLMGNYNAAQNFNAAGNFMENMQRAAWADTKKVSQSPSNFQMRLVYTKGGGAANDVDILLFQQAFLTSNGGVFLSNGDLQFTNDTGNTATISMIGRNAPTVEEFYNILDTEPMNLGWCRMFVQDESQKAFGMVFSNREQFGSKEENDLSPNIYDNQYTYRPLIQDVPLNFRTSKKKGILWTLGTTETTPGTRIVFFVDSVMSPDHALNNQSMIQDLGPGTQFQLPAQPLVNGGLQMGMQNPQGAAMLAHFLQIRSPQNK